MRWVMIFMIILLAGCANEDRFVEDLEVLDEVVEEDIELLEDEIIDNDSLEIVEDVLELEEEPLALETVESLELVEEEVELIQPTDDSSIIRDDLYESRERTYYFNDGSFGVGGKDAPKYDGPVPIVSNLGIEFQMDLFNIILTPEKAAHFQINWGSEFEGTRPLKEGEFHVTKDGIKLTIEKIFKNKIIFNLSKVPDDEIPDLCKGCIKLDRLMKDDQGIGYINVNDVWGYRPRDSKLYWFKIIDLDRETNDLRLRVNTEELPLLQPEQEYILRDGLGLRFLYSAAHYWGGRDQYGYAAFGFVEKHEIPDHFVCPDCTRFVYLEEGKTQNERINNRNYELKVSKSGDKVFFHFGDSKGELKMMNFTKINDEVSVILLRDDPQYQIGWTHSEDTKSRITCKERKDNGFDFEKQSNIVLQIGSTDDDEFEREDFCLDKKTLVEYACKEVEGRKGKESSGEDFTGILTYAKCDCYKGTCRDEPSCAGLDC